MVPGVAGLVVPGVPGLVVVPAEIVRGLVVPPVAPVAEDKSVELFPVKPVGLW